MGLWEFKKTMSHQVKKISNEGWYGIFWQVFYVLFAVTVLLFFVINVLLIKNIFSDQRNVFASDLPQFYSAALMTKEGKGQMIYDIETHEEYQNRVFGLETRIAVVPFRNPSFAVLLYLPFTTFNLVQSYGIFAIFNFVLLFLIAYRSSKIFNQVKTSFLLPILPLAFYPNTLSIVRGQISILMLVFFLVFYNLLKSRPFFAGVVYSLLLIKPQFAIVGFPFFFIITRQKRRFILGTALSFLALLLISLFLSGFKALVAYPNFLLSTENILFGSPAWAMFSLNNFFSFILRFLSPNPIYLYLSQAALYLFTIFFFLRKSRESNYDTKFLSAAIFLTVFSVHVLPYDLSLLFVPILILLNRAFSDKSKNSWVMIVIAGLIFVIPNLVIADIYAFGPLILFLIGFLILITNPLNTQSKIATSSFRH